MLVDSDMGWGSNTTIFARVEVGVQLGVGVGGVLYGWGLLMWRLGEMEGFKRGEVFLRTSFDLISIGVVVNCPALETWKTANTLKVAYLLSWWEDRRGFWHQIIWCADGGTWQIGVACADMESVNHLLSPCPDAWAFGTGFHAFL